jgi:hypothetical protein
LSIAKCWVQCENRLHEVFDGGWRTTMGINIYLLRNFIIVSLFYVLLLGILVFIIY